MSQQPEKESSGGAVSWMARNPVAANLFMLVLMVGGFVMSSQIKQEVFPEFELDIVTVQIPYPGASPEEVEKGVLLVAEEAVRGINDVKQVTASAGESVGSVTVELIAGADADKNLNDIKSAVDRITSFPEEAERPVVQLVSNRKEVISLIIHGPKLGEETLRQLAEDTREGLLQDERITQVDLAGARDREISIEVPQEQLRNHNLTLGQISSRIRSASIDLPSGGIKTQGGEILLRTTERREFGQEYGNIEIRSDANGGRILLKDIATIKDGFNDADVFTSFDGNPAIRLTVYRVGDQTPITVSDATKEYVETHVADLPPGVDMAIWSDRSEIYRDRINLLLRNALMGLVLVFAILGLFLQFRLAFWVTLGIPISFLGSMLFMPVMDVSINMISLFAFIVTLGMVVDDAIVVGENIYTMRQKGLGFMEAAVQGAKDVAVPVTFSIATTVVAFMPMLFVPGASGKFFAVIPAIVISVLLISLFESLFILPAHLGHGSAESTGIIGIIGFIDRQQARFSNGLESFIQTFYKPSVSIALRWRYLTFAVCIALFIATVGMVAGGRVQFRFMPKIDSDVVTARARLPVGAPFEDSLAMQKKLESAARELLEEHGGDKIKRGLFAQTGQSIPGGGPGGGGSALGSHIADMSVFMVPTDQRDITAGEFARAWRKKVGDVPGLDSLTFKFSTGPSGGDPINIQLSHTDVKVLENAAAELAQRIKTYNGVKDIDNGFSAGKPQWDFTLTEEALALGLTENDVARQLRSAFFGVEAARLQRGRDEVRTYVRLPREDRRTEKTLSDLLLRTPLGGEIPLSIATRRTLGNSPTSIKRVDGRRVLNITADVDGKGANANTILGSVKTDVLPGLLADYPGLSYSLEGEQRSQSESLGSLGRGMMLAMMVIFILLAIPFRSYTQPIIIMSAIPFGLVGAILGHVVMGLELSLMSIMGIVALTGIVVNDSLVLIVAINRMREEGEDLFVAVREGGVKRFRPILLTSLTTFFGLVPMVLETSVQARFLIPMAVSLAFGVLFATFIILLLVPSLYMILEDIRSLLTRNKGAIAEDPIDPTMNTGYQDSRLKEA